MKRLLIVLLTVAVALAIALPAGAKKPDKPDGRGFKPVACQIDKVLPDPVVTLLGDLTVAYTVDPAALGDPSPGDVLCAEVRVTEGTLSDLRVRWLDYLTNREGGCKLNWARGKELSDANNGAVFAVGLSLENWSADGGLCGAQYDNDGGNMTVVVMPAAKSDTVTMTVKIGIDQP
jgi:hypothetical protein